MKGRELQCRVGETQHNKQKDVCLMSAKLSDARKIGVSGIRVRERYKKEIPNVRSRGVDSEQT